MTSQSRSTCPHFDNCMKEHHASVICLMNYEAKFHRCSHRPDEQQSKIEELLQEAIDDLMRMSLEDLIEARLMRFAVKDESPELIGAIRDLMAKIKELSMGGKEDYADYELHHEGGCIQHDGHHSGYSGAPWRQEDHAGV